MIGLFGGTFDPVHNGHIFPVEETARALELDSVSVVPAGQPPHRPPPVAGKAHRLRMAQLAFAGRKGFVVDERELRQAHPSYTVDTLASLRAEFPREALCLIVGLDAFLSLESWHQWQRLPEFAHIVVMHRPGWERRLPDWAVGRLRADPDALRRQPAGCVCLQAVTPLPISATAIRAAIARGESVEALMPSTVWAYIRQHHLYQQKEQNGQRANPAVGA